MSITKKPFLALTATAVTTPLMVFWRGYPWPMALVIGIAAGVLLFYTLRTIEQLKEEFRR